MEIGESQASPLTDCFLASGFTEVTVRKDLAGRVRYIGARLTGLSIQVGGNDAAPPDAPQRLTAPAEMTSCAGAARARTAA